MNLIKGTKINMNDLIQNLKDLSELFKEMQKK